MRFAAIFIWLALTQAAFSQTAVVKTGDHKGFTRLVIELPTAADWKMGRTAEGYELRIASENLRYDLASVFDTIRHDRLASIWADPESGGLRLGIACACYALPFEFRPGIIVIDLRDGQPPNQSEFETALDGADASPLKPKPNQRPLQRPQRLIAANPDPMVSMPYDWLGDSAQFTPKIIDPTLPLPKLFASTVNDINPLKDALLLQLSRGAAQGIVQMTQPNLASRSTVAPLPIGPRANIHLGEAPGFAVETLRSEAKALAKSGNECLKDNMLDLREWGDDQAVPDQLAKARANLIGEFDRPQQDAVIAAAKLLIYLGFGAEAKQLLTQFSIESADTSILTSMAKLVDGASDADGPFGGMQNCDTAAALWAAMALPQFKASESPRTQAVLSAFSALPNHLRQSLGPDLAAKFLEIDDVSTAQSLRQAVQRGSRTPETKTTVMSAKIDVAAGQPEKAAAELEPEVGVAGPATAETLIALVDAQLAADQPVDPETAIALAALVNEQTGSNLEPALRRAEILAMGASGNFDDAFELAQHLPTAEPELWVILAKSKSDTALLDHAVLPNDANVPDLAVGLRVIIAEKLLNLGLPDAALVWIGAPNGATTDAERLLAAQANIATGDASAAISWIANLDDAKANDLRAKALAQQDRPLDAAKAWADANNPEADLRAQSWAGNWEGLAKSDASRFKAAADLVRAKAAPDGAQQPATLALGNALVADSGKARQILGDLLNDVPALKMPN